MKRFEYLVKTFVNAKFDKMNVEEIQKELKVLGENGWELINFNFDGVNAVLKRDKFDGVNAISKRNKKYKQLLTEEKCSSCEKSYVKD